jgi:hypothetical protein
MLEDHVPLTLLIDLCVPPHTDEIYAVEGGHADWLQTPSAA